MALTKVTYSMIEGSPLNVLDYGADPTGIDNCAAAFNAAIAALSGGGAIYVPSGTYKIATSVVLDDNITIFGDGATTVISSFTAGTIDNAENGTFVAKSKTNVTLRGLNFVCGSNGGLRVKFILTNNIYVVDCFFDGYLPSTDLMDVVLYVGGCDDVYVENTEFKDIRDALYLCRDNHTTGTDTKQTNVSGCLFYQEHHGTSHQYPTGIYVFYAEKTIITFSTFKNIKPSTNNPSYYGYGIYEGDGEAEIVRISNCTFIDDDGITNGVSHGTLISFADSAFIENCSFNGPLRPMIGCGNETVVTGNVAYSTSSCNFQKQSGAPVGGTFVFSNNIFSDLSGNLQWGGAGHGNINALICSNNTINTSTGPGFTFEEIDYVQAVGNTIIDCNTSTGTGVNGSGFVFNGPTLGLVSDNIVVNQTAAGKAEYGVWFVSSSLNNVVVTPTNSFQNMTTGSAYQARTGAPTVGKWMKGSRFWYFDTLTAGGTEGVVCVTAGTPGTWKEFGSVQA